MERIESRQGKKVKRQQQPKPQATPGSPPLMPQPPAQNTAAMGTASALSTYLSANLAEPAHPLVEHEVCPLLSMQLNTPGNQVVSPRRFDHAHYYPMNWPLNDIHIQRGRYFYLTCPWSNRCPCCHVHMPHYEFPVISIHGACFNDSNNEARAARCVFFGFENAMNFACPLEPGHRQTGQLAELGACIYALTKVEKFLQKWKRDRTRGHLPSRLHTVIIKSDSSYIVNGITEWVQKWKSNGWKNCKGQPVANVESWKLVDDLVGKLEKEIGVKFWLVSREANAMAEVAGRRAVLHAQDTDHLLNNTKLA